MNENELKLNDNKTKVLLSWQCRVFEKVGAIKYEIMMSIFQAK